MYEFVSGSLKNWKGVMKANEVNSLPFNNHAVASQWSILSLLLFLLLLRDIPEPTNPEVFIL